MVGNFTGHDQAHRRATVHEDGPSRSRRSRSMVRDGGRTWKTKRTTTSTATTTIYTSFHDGTTDVAAEQHTSTTTSHPTGEEIRGDPAAFSLSYINQPRRLTRLVLRDDRTRTSRRRRLTTTKVAIDRYFSKKTPPRATRAECGRDGGIRAAPPPQLPGHRLHVVSRVVHRRAPAAAPSKGERSTPPGRPESPGYAISLVASPPDVFLSPSIPLLGWRHGNGVGDRSRTPYAHLGRILSVSRTILTG